LLIEFLLATTVPRTNARPNHQVSLRDLCLCPVNPFRRRSHLGDLDSCKFGWSTLKPLLFSAALC